MSKEVGNREIPWKVKNLIAGKVAKYLKKHCPFFCQGTDLGGSVWHHCSCLDLPKHNDSCVCVWRTESTCHRGSWPELGQILHREYEKIKKWQEKNPLLVPVDKEELLANLPKTVFIGKE